MPRMVEFGEMLDFLAKVYYDTPDDLTEWEADFLSNVLMRDSTTLSDKQLDTIERIYKKLRG